jgi:hypothetical protein
LHNKTIANLILLKWVFIYKNNLNSYLIKCRLRIIVKGNLQEEQSILLTYIAILVTRLFRIFIAIIAYFNLEIKQFDIINAFANAKRLVNSLLVTC